MHLKGQTCFEAPDNGCLVVAGGHEESVVSSEADVMHVEGVCRQCGRDCVICLGHSPEHDGVVVAGGGQQAAYGGAVNLYYKIIKTCVTGVAECDAPHAGTVTRQGPQDAYVAPVYQVHVTIAGGRWERSAHE